MNGLNDLDLKLCRQSLPGTIWYNFANIFNGRLFTHWLIPMRLEPQAAHFSAQQLIAIPARNSHSS
jgi:hypothetical protein